MARCFKKLDKNLVDNYEPWDNKKLTVVIKSFEKYILYRRRNTLKLHYLSTVKFLDMSIFSIYRCTSEKFIEGLEAHTSAELLTTGGRGCNDAPCSEHAHSSIIFHYRNTTVCLQ